MPHGVHMRFLSISIVLSATGCADSDDIIVKTGPAHDAIVQLADADVWLVPPLPKDDDPMAPNSITWTLAHPSTKARATITRTCWATNEAELKINDPPDEPVSKRLASGPGCTDFASDYTTAWVELAFDGTKWIGVASGHEGGFSPPE